MPVNQNCYFKINIDEKEYPVKFTAQVMREFLKLTEESLFNVPNWIDDDDKVFTALDLSLKAAGNTVVTDDMSLEEVGIFKAQLMMMISNIDDLQKKIMLPLQQKMEKVQITQQKQQTEIISQLLKNQSTDLLSESVPLPE
ncbi:MAG: hypothetical protein WC748_09980 [Legionellales bacterium]|jgi:hypothetical protein